MVTPGRLHAVAETKEINPLIKNIPITILLYISMYDKIK